MSIFKKQEPITLECHSNILFETLWATMPPIEVIDAVLKSQISPEATEWAATWKKILSPAGHPEVEKFRYQPNAKIKKPVGSTMTDSELKKKAAWAVAKEAQKARA